MNFYFTIFIVTCVFPFLFSIDFCPFGLYAAGFEIVGVISIKYRFVVVIFVKRNISTF